MKTHSLKKDLANCKHPNSRKAKALAKRTKKFIARNDNLSAQNLKWTVLATKVQWFLTHLDPNCSKYTKEQAKELIESYLARFNEELEQIAIKHSIGNRKNRQHANREDVIKLTISREKEEYTTCGLEVPNILNPVELKLLKAWDGNTTSLQHLKLIKLSKKLLET